MNELSELLLGLAGFSLAVVLITVIVSVTRARRLPLQRPSSTLIAREEIPEAQRALFDSVGPRLAALGFVPAYAQRTLRYAATLASDPLYQDVLLHPGEAVVASVEIPEAPDYGEPVSVTFMTEYADGTAAWTINRLKHYLLPLAPEWSVDDDYLPAFEDTYRAHVRRVHASGRTVVREVDTLRERTLTGGARLFQSWIDRGIAIPVREPERWRLSWSAALKLVVKALFGLGRAMRAKPSALAPAGEALVIERQYAATKSLQWSRGDKHLLTWISIAAFAALGAWLWTWTFMLILLGVIGLHEMGHFFAMRIVGYRNLHVFFVPGLGGLATGQKADATPLQKVFVYLAGPVPGLILCIVIAAATNNTSLEGRPWLADLIAIAFIVNFLNLLPVTPLDGGRVAETLLFSKVPLLRLVFAGICAALLLGAGLYTGDWVLRFVGLFVAITLPHQWRVYRLESSLPPREGALEEPQARAVVFAAAAAPQFARWSGGNRAAAALALVDEVQARKPRWGEVVAGLAIYAVCLVPPALAALHIAQPGLGLLGPPSIPKSAGFVGPPVPPRDWKTEIAQAVGKPPMEQLELMLTAMEAGYPDEGEEEPGVVESKAWAIAKTLPPGNRLRTRALYALATVDDRDAATPQFRAAEKELSEVTGEDRLTYARLLEFKVRYTGATGIDDLRRALSIRESLSPVNSPPTVRTRSRLALRLYEAGSRAEAGQLLERSVTGERPGQVSDRWAADREFVDFLIAEGRSPEAEQRLEAIATDARVQSGPKHKVVWLEEAVSRRLLAAQLSQATPAASARARSTLEAIETLRDTASGGKGWARAYYHHLDRLAVADAIGDAAMAQSATLALRDQYAGKPSAKPLCEMFTPDSLADASPLDRPRLASYARRLERLGLCPHRG
ncbi:hypothetical protein BWI17_04490 [Betaproteobacteria bacterium GR16-43]|nr:hypothetical protein BWI17_04490 [Betaproteobacteria bacterium GR16-43]